MRQIDPITGKGLRGILDSLRDASPGPSDQGRPIYRVLSDASMEIIAAALWSSFSRGLQEEVLCLQTLLFVLDKGKPDKLDKIIARNFTRHV
jgi:hypothetical protein